MKGFENPKARYCITEAHTFVGSFLTSEKDHSNVGQSELYFSIWYRYGDFENVASGPSPLCTVYLTMIGTSHEKMWSYFTSEMEVKRTLYGYKWKFLIWFSSLVDFQSDLSKLILPLSHEILECFWCATKNFLTRRTSEVGPSKDVRWLGRFFVSAGRTGCVCVTDWRPPRKWIFRVILRPRTPVMVCKSGLPRSLYTYLLIHDLKNKLTTVKVHGSFSKTRKS